VRVLAVAAALAWFGSACTTAVDGRPVGAGRPASTGSRSAPTARFDCDRSRVVAVVSCLDRSLDQYWRRALHRAFSVGTVVAPSAAAVPRGCRAALRLQTAFTCPIGNRVYLTPGYITRLRTAAPRAVAWLRFAATLAHEAGHVVQFTVREPSVERQRSTAAQTRAVEQQADCLSGLWAASVGLPDDEFRDAAATVFTIVDSAFERRTHGPPNQRLAAIARGQRGSTARACGVTVR
jgi:predicted metalloprotease